MNAEKTMLSIMFVMAMVVSIGTLIFARPINPEIYSQGLIGGMCSIIGIYLLFEILSSPKRRKKKVEVPENAVGGEGK